MYISSLGSSPGLDIHREGVGELQPEFQTLLVRQMAEAVEHGHRIGVLQILLKVMVIKGNVVIAHAVQNRPGGVITQEWVDCI